MSQKCKLYRGLNRQIKLLYCVNLISICDTTLIIWTFICIFSISTIYFKSLIDFRFLNISAVFIQKKQENTIILCNCEKY